MIESTIQTVLGKTWLQSRLRQEHINTDNVVSETVAYQENTKIRLQYSIHNNKIHGICRIWNSNGILQSESSYVHGVLDGLQKEWHPNGKLKKESNYKEGQIDGVRKEWYETGVLKLKCFYVQNCPAGEWLEWYGNGQLRSQSHYVGDVWNGEFEYRPPDACLEHSRLENGAERYWLPDGNLRKKDVYLRGYRIPVKIYDLIQSMQLSAKDVLGMKNATIRRICLEELGYARFLAQVDHQIIEKDGEYELVRIDWHEREEPICLVKVKCPSTGAFYTLRVPPRVQTVKEAIAWTFGLKSGEYRPEKET
jgi:antitoxin component YwqK of YwqJK toxin-antitoxin module